MLDKFDKVESDRMKRNSKSILCATIVVIVLLFITLNVFAHSGRTDSSGGHRDNNNKSGLGSYHYHHGYGPHLHTDGNCPYETINETMSTEISVDDIYIDSTDVTLHTEEQRTLSVTISPYDATNKSVTWTSSNINVVTVDSGVITAIGAGSAIVTVKSSNDKTHSINVTVIQEIEDITISEQNLTLKVGESKTLSCTFYPMDAVEDDIIWSSKDVNIVTVNNTGTVTAIKSGITNIMVKTNNGKTDSIMVTVNDNKSPTIETPVVATPSPNEELDDEENGGLLVIILFGGVILLANHFRKQKKK